MNLPVLKPSEFLSLANQTLDYAYPIVEIVGELANYKISKGKWLYADIKDEFAKIRCFGSVFVLPGPLEDGLMVQITAQAKIHPQYGFSLNLQSIKPIGEGSIKKAGDLLKSKLESEGLFSSERKRQIPYAPTRVGLIASEQSAAYTDFIKILNHRWHGVEIELFDVQVQGESAPETLLSALNYFNQEANPVEVLVMIRGGGSPEDLSPFNSEQVTRAVAGSRIPTVVAIGHEIDISLSELAADLRASTPSNAAELLFPDKLQSKKVLLMKSKSFNESLNRHIDTKYNYLSDLRKSLSENTIKNLDTKSENLDRIKVLLESVHPKSTLKRGYALVQLNGRLVSTISDLKFGDIVSITLNDGNAKAKVMEVE